jgi:hypothetical protein
LGYFGLILRIREIPYKINWLGYCKRFANQDNCLYGHLTGTHRREEMTTETKEIQGAVKIGNGTKLHKAYKDKRSNAGWQQAIICGFVVVAQELNRVLHTTAQNFLPTQRLLAKINQRGLRPPPFGEQNEHRKILLGSQHQEQSC